jgi:hypothetical protein
VAQARDVLPAVLVSFMLVEDASSLVEAFDRRRDVFTESVLFPPDENLFGTGVHGRPLSSSSRLVFSTDSCRGGLARTVRRIEHQLNENARMMSTAVNA